MSAAIHHIFSRADRRASATHAWVLKYASFDPARECKWAAACVAFAPAVYNMRCDAKRSHLRWFYCPRGTLSLLDLWIISLHSTEGCMPEHISTHIQTQQVDDAGSCITDGMAAAHAVCVWIFIETPRFQAQRASNLQVISTEVQKRKHWTLNRNK